MKLPFTREGTRVRKDTTSGGGVRTRSRGSAGMARSEARAAFVFLLPWIIGFIVFTSGPLIASLYLSLTDYNVLQPPSWVGLSNYSEILGSDDLFRKSLLNSIYYTILFIPLHIISALIIALLLNTRIRAISLWRTFFYLPTVTPVVAAAVLWRFLLNPQAGVVNQLLGSIGLPTPGWTTDPHWLIRTVAIMVTWMAVGNTMVIYLAGLKGIPVELYEAADLDGAGWFAKTWHVTLPMLSPVIFFTLIVGVISSIQVFAQPRVLFNDPQGGSGNAALMYMMYLFNNAFSYFKMGYASALAWILFIVILILTALQFWASRRWVYYEGEAR